VPIITVPQGFDEAFPATVRWVKAQGSIEIGFREGQGFVVRALDGGGIVFESQAGKSVGQTLTTLERRVARADLPVQTVRKSAAPRRPKSRGRRGKAAGATARSTRKVGVPISAAERRLILAAAHLDDEIADRLEKIDPREDLVSLTIDELVRLAIATAGDPNRLADEPDRNLWVRLSDRLHEAVGDCLRSGRS
jgi:hypothetical protein